MTAHSWFLVGWFAVNALTMVYLVGKPRPIVSPGSAVFGVVMYAAFIAWTVAVAA